MDGASTVLTGIGYVVVAMLSSLGGCVILACAWKGAAVLGREYAEWQRERRAAEAVEDIVRNGGIGR